MIMYLTGSPHQQLGRYWVTHGIRVAPATAHSIDAVRSKPNCIRDGACPSKYAAIIFGEQVQPWASANIVPCSI